MSSWRRLACRGYASLFGVQFGGALSDNVLRNAVIAMIAFGALAHDPGDRALLTQAALGLFMLPFFLFSASAGRFADSCPDLATAVKFLKAGEVGTMAVAAVGLALGSLPVLLAAVFLAGLQSAFFGPFKYSMLPRLLERDALMSGNALLNASTYAAIIIGVFWGTQLGAAAGNELAVTAALAAIAVAGLVCALLLPALAGPAGAGWRSAWSWSLLRNIAVNVRACREVPGLMSMIMLISWFWMTGGIVLANLPLLVRESLGFGPTTYMFLLLVVCVGVAAGSALVVFILRGKISMRLVPAGVAISGLGCMLPVWPAGSAGQAGEAEAALGTLGEFLHSAEALPVVGMLLVLSVALGFYIVPMYASMQVVTPPAILGRAVATNNVFNALFIVCGVLVAGAIIARIEAGSTVGAAIQIVFIALGAGSLAMAWWGSRFLRRVGAGPAPAAGGDL